MTASFYGPNSSSGDKRTWLDLSEVFGESEDVEQHQPAVEIASIGDPLPPSLQAASTRNTSVSHTGSAYSTSSFSSFYPRGGGVASSGVSVPELPWTKREAFRREDDRPSSRERRHRSSWHASLNKRLVAIESAEDLLAVVNRELNGFDMLNTVTALNRLSRLPGARRMQRDFRVLEVMYRIEAWLNNASVTDPDPNGPEAVLPKHLASVATGLARLQWKDSTAGRILRMIGAIAPRVLPQARARDLSNLAWAFATLELRGFDSMLLAVAREAVAQIHEFNEQNLSNTCWAYAKLGLRHDPLIKAIADETLKKLPHFSAQGLTNTIWGFATMVIKGEECLGQSAWKLICALLEELMTRLSDCPTQQLSNSAWACCRLGVRHDAFMAAIADEGMKKIADYTPQDLANTSMAFAKPNINNRSFLHAIAREAARKMHKFEAREVSNITWSLNIMGPGLIDPEWIGPALEHFAALVKNPTNGARNDGDFEGWEMVQVLNACWSYRQDLSQWPRLASIFRERIYGPVVRCLAAIVGQEDHAPSCNGLTTLRDAHAGNTRSLESDGATKKLFSAGPLTSGNLAAAAAGPTPREPLDAARQDAQDIIEKLQVDFLGPVFTRAALRDLGFIDPADQRMRDPFGASHSNEEVPDWGVAARRKVADALATLKAELPYMWFDRFGPHERRVQCWIAYRLEVEVTSRAGPLRTTLSEDGRIANFSLDEHRAICQHGEETFARLQEVAVSRGVELHFTVNDVRRAQQWLQGLFAQHDRAGHCERQALLEVVLEVVSATRELQRRQSSEDQGWRVERCINDGFFDGSSGVCVRGHMRMFVCHFYCISCLAAISNFARRFPLVTLHMDYDDCWRTRLLDV